jgi:uncharacterized delta-60 repeat protein
LAGDKALVGGLFTSFDGANCGRIARLDANGRLDETFDAGIGANGDVLSVAAQPGGKVAIGGEFTKVDGENRRGVAVLHSDGTLDGAFAPVSGANSTVTSVAIQPDGRVLIGGDFTTANGTNRSRIARFNPDGSLDETFDPGLGANARVESIALQIDGRVLLGGQFTSVNGTNRNRIARLNENGSLDTTFIPGNGADGFVMSVAVHSDGKILIGGEFFSVGGLPRPRIARLNVNGSVDDSFSPGIGANDSVTSVAWQVDGDALVGGFFNTVNGIGRSCVARLEADQPGPFLFVQRDVGGIVLSWPAAYSNFTLQSAGAPLFSDAWSPVVSVPVLAGDRLVVTNSINPTPRFFRLQKE